MGTILATNFKLYRCATWPEGDTHGGAISATPIADSGDQVIFDDVTDAQRVSGGDEYRKVFVKNENADTVSLKVWIDTQYTATNQHIFIKKGTSAGVQSVEGVATGYTQPTTLETGLDLGTLANGASAAIWIKRTVDAGGNGYVGDTFKIKVGMY